MDESGFLVTGKHMLIHTHERTFTMIEPLSPATDLVACLDTSFQKGIDLRSLFPRDLQSERHAELR